MDFTSNLGSQNMFTSLVPSPPMIHYNHEAWQVVAFWKTQLNQIQTAQGLKSQLKLPVARVKRIMKSEGGAKMVSSETPILMSKACELFIQLLIFRSWLCSIRGYYRAVSPSDVAQAIVENLELDFLTDTLSPALIQPYAQAEQGRNAVQGQTQGAISLGTNFMGNPILNSGNQGTTVLNIAPENNAALPFDAFMGHPMMNIGTGVNTAAGGNQNAMLYGANYMGNSSMNTGTEFGNALSLFTGDQAPLQFGAQLVGRSAQFRGFQGGNAVNNQSAMSYDAIFMENLMMNMSNEPGNNDLNIMGGTQFSSIPNNATFTGNPPMINTGNDQAGTSQEFPQASDMMEPTFMPSADFPYNNYHLK